MTIRVVLKTLRLESGSPAEPRPLFPAYEIGIAEPSISYVVEKTLCEWIRRSPDYDSGPAAAPLLDPPTNVYQQET
jgi:hypothetical protein